MKFHEDPYIAFIPFGGLITDMLLAICAKLRCENCPRAFHVHCIERWDMVVVGWVGGWKTNQPAILQGSWLDLVENWGGLYIYI